MSLPEARRRTALYLARLEMSDVLDRRVEELSKGNQQKIQIAATLVSDPEVIVLDEPFVGLDPLNLRLSKDILSEERKAGKTILLSTHQMNQVEELCDSLFMLNQGVRVLYGTVAEIMDRYSEPALLVECSPIPEEIPEIDRIVRDGVAQKIYPKPGVSHTAVLKALIDRGVQIDSLQKATTPLEEIFIRVVRESRKEAQS
jgi:ABC-2 type transport system ATP-binding protein